jgi:hypothetical protein
MDCDTSSHQRRTPPAWIAVLLAALACGGQSESIRDCVARGGIEPICGFENPEDLAVMPGGTWLVVSQFAGAGGEVGGSLVAFRPSDGRRHALFPDPDGEPSRGQAESDDERWGSPECPGPPDPEAFGPHGIDLDVRAHRLAVVNHGDREAVELFEVGHDRRGLALFWRGCVPIPEDVWANDVALLPDGGFVLTRMLGAKGFDRILSILQMFFGGNTGWVLEWTPGEGVDRVPDSQGSGPNGIVVSRDGRTIYFAEWSGSRLVRLRRDGDGNVLDRRSIDLPHHPDNITWTRSGELLVTGQIGPLGELLACGDTEEGTCALPFSVIRVGPGTLDTMLVLEHDPAVAHGAGTVALEFRGDILIGTFDGDRLGRAPYER